jgi:1-acyl-sn-glycerol-3-phosphate acyltransferase
VLQPTPEQLAPLTVTERLSYRLADFVNRRMRWYTERQNRYFGASLVSMCGGRRYHIHGLENIADVTPDDRIILVANHRSFFDFYVIMTLNFAHTAIGGRLLFPVRSTFFYDRPIGSLLHLSMSAMTMFPPIMRDKRKRAFNRYAVQRIMLELEQPGTVIGFHPEGTRNKAHPYALLPAKPGVGEVILRADANVKVIPIFVVGMGSNLIKESLRNWFRPKDFPIDLVYGAPIDFSEFAGRPDTRETHLAIADRCMKAISDLAVVQQQQGMLKLPTLPQPQEASG